MSFPSSMLAPLWPFLRSHAAARASFPDFLLAIEAAIDFDELVMGYVQDGIRIVRGHPALGTVWWGQQPPFRPEFYVACVSHY